MHAKRDDNNTNFKGRSSYSKQIKIMPLCKAWQDDNNGGIPLGTCKMNEIPGFLHYYFHPEVMQKEHRDKCPSCQMGITAMDLLLSCIKDQEKKP